MTRPDKEGAENSASRPSKESVVNSLDEVPVTEGEELLEEALEETFPASDPMSSLRFT